MGRQPALTKIGTKRIHEVRVRGGSKKFRALRLDSGNFSWGSEAIAKKTRIISTVYNASNNELVRTNTIVKSAIVLIDATPFRQWYEAHYATSLTKAKGKKSGAKEETHAEGETEVKKSKNVLAKLAARKPFATLDPLLEEQLASGRVYGAFYLDGIDERMVWYDCLLILACSLYSVHLVPSWTIWPR